MTKLRLIGAAAVSFFCAGRTRDGPPRTLRSSSPCPEPLFARPGKREIPIASIAITLPGLYGDPAAVGTARSTMLAGITPALYRESAALMHKARYCLGRTNEVIICPSLLRQGRGTEAPRLSGLHGLSLWPGSPGHRTGCQRACPSLGETGSRPR